MNDIILQFSKALGTQSSRRYDGAMIGRITYRQITPMRSELPTEITITENPKKAFTRIHLQRKSGEEICDEVKLMIIMPKQNISNIHNAAKSMGLSAGYSDGSRFTKFSKNDVYDFSRSTGDSNPIHMNEKPIVQGMLLFVRLMEYLEFPEQSELKFIYPVFAEQEIYLCEETDSLKGAADGRICFQMKYTKEEKTDES